LRPLEEVVSRKTREAAEAELPPYRTVHMGPVDRLHAVGNEWSRKLFDGDFYLSRPPPDLPATNLVFVQSRDRNTGTRNPSSLGGGATDKHLIYEGLSRVAADGVLAGAQTVRGSSVVLSIWRRELIELRESLALPRHPIQIVATLGRLAFDDTLLLNVPELAVIVLTTPEWIERMRPELAARRWITAIPMAHRDGLSGAFRTLRAMGIVRISAIGGRTIARALLDAGLVQDLYLTTSPRTGGEPNTPLSPTPIGGAVAVEKIGTGVESGVKFEHILIR
jgi:riboflavin biosynthesis pyrimidine reductase